MRVIVDKRVEQTLRHLLQREAARIFVFMEQLQEQSLEAFRARRDVELRGKGGLGELYSIRVTDKLRIICRWRPSEQELYIEDVVSRDVLDRYFTRGGP